MFPAIALVILGIVVALTGDDDNKSKPEGKPEAKEENAKPKAKKKPEPEAAS